MPSNNDFLSDPSQKPYDFVPLPDTPQIKDPAIAGHHTAIGTSHSPLLSGHIRAIIETESLTHIASGIVSLIDDIRELSGQGQDLDIKSIGKDDLVMPHIRTNNVRIIPGSTIKGMLRSAIEAITYPGVNISPAPSLGKKQMQSIVTKQSLQKSPNLSHISLANRLFGITDKNHSYQGQCIFYDAPQINGNAQIFRRLPLYSPQPYFSQTNNIQTNYNLYFTDAARKKFRGRKFYRRGITREANPPYTAIEACNKGSQFVFEIQFSNLTDAELGILLIILGLKGTTSSTVIPRLNVGSGKPLAMGAIRFKDIIGKIITASTYTDFDAQYQSLDLISCIDAAYSSGMIFSAGLEKLGEIMQEKIGRTAGGAGKERIY